MYKNETTALEYLIADLALNEPAKYKDIKSIVLMLNEILNSVLVKNANQMLDEFLQNKDPKIKQELDNRGIKEVKTLEDFLNILAKQDNALLNNIERINSLKDEYRFILEEVNFRRHYYTGLNQIIDFSFYQKTKAVHSFKTKSLKQISLKSDLDYIFYINYSKTKDPKAAELYSTNRTKKLRNVNDKNSVIDV